VLKNDQGLRAQWTSFRADESGAVTVDWIVLTAAAVFMGMGAAFFIAAGVPDVADGISNYMDTISFDQ